ncbi:MAG TPA: alpha/beta fold hydrolase [Gemmatimonadaceae bacterium]|nr:alpha/beta fold hydrolase [Gemmatimonadaceae bacterium]
MSRPLTPIQMFPSGIDTIATRLVSLPTGVRVRVAESVGSEGAPVLLLHGWGASMYSFRHAFSLLPSYGLRVIAADLRGFGLSDKPRGDAEYTLAAFLRDLESLLDALTLPAAALVGHSMGGGVALHYALRRADRVSKLVLVNAAGLARPTLLPPMRLPPLRMIDAFGRALVPRWLIEFILRYVAYGDPDLVTEHDVDEYWAPTQLPGYMHAARACLGEFDWHVVTEDEAASLAVPTRVILGTDDRLIRNARGTAERLCGARVTMVAGGHCVHEEHPSEVYRWIGDFLRG